MLIIRSSKKPETLHDQSKQVIIQAKMSVQSTSDRIARIKQANIDLMHRMEIMQENLRTRREKIKSDVLIIQKQIDLNDAIIGAIKLREHINNLHYC